MDRTELWGQMDWPGIEHRCQDRVSELRREARGSLEHREVKKTREGDGKKRSFLGGRLRAGK